MPAHRKPKLYNTLMRWFVLTGMAGALLSLVISFLVAYCWLKEYNRDLLVEIEKSEVLSNWSGIVLTIVVSLMGVIAVIVIPLSRSFAGKIVLPLIKVTEKVRVFAENYQSGIFSWSALERPEYEELAVLNDSFYRMGEKISQLMESLAVQAQYDALTGLANRMHFFEHGQQVIELIQRNERSCALIFLDIDRFKRINDTYGHIVGDEVLKSLAGIFARSVRISDVLGRLGGEEFTIVMPDTDEEGAKNLAERLRKAVEETPVTAGDITLKITVSIGIAMFYGVGEKIDGKELLENLIKKADAAMYKAKEKGRNRVELYQEDILKRNQLKLFLDDDGPVR